MISKAMIKFRSKFQLQIPLQFEILKFNHGFTNHGYLHSAVWRALHNVKNKKSPGGKK